MKELETMKQLKPHPYVIKVLGCVTESGMLCLWRFNFAVRIFLTINSVRLVDGFSFLGHFFCVGPLSEYIQLQKLVETMLATELASLLGQLVERCTGIAKVTSSNPVQA